VYFWELVDSFQINSIENEKPTEKNFALVKSIEPEQGSFQGYTFIELKGRFDIVDPEIQIKFHDYVSPAIINITPTTILCMSPKFPESELVEEETIIDVTITNKDGKRIDAGSDVNFTYTNVPGEDATQLLEFNPLNRSELLTRGFNGELSAMKKEFYRCGIQSLQDVDSFGRNILHLLFAQGRTALVKFLFEELKPNPIIAAQLLAAQDYHLRTPIELVNLYRLKQFMNDLRDLKNQIGTEIVIKVVPPKSNNLLVNKTVNDLQQADRKSPTRRASLMNRVINMIGNRGEVDNSVWSVFIPKFYTDEDRTDTEFMNKLAVTPEKERTQTVRDFVQSSAKNENSPIRRMVDKFTAQFSKIHVVTNDTAWISTKKGVVDVKSFSSKIVLYS
jgi:hypothetical protein